MVRASGPCASWFHFAVSAHRFGENAQRFSAATAVLLVCAAVSHAGVAVFLIAGAGEGSVKAK